MLVGHDCSIRSFMSMVSPNVKSEMDRLCSNPCFSTSWLRGLKVHLLLSQLQTFQPLSQVHPIQLCFPLQLRVGAAEGHYWAIRSSELVPEVLTCTHHLLEKHSRTCSRYAHSSSWSETDMILIFPIYKLCGFQQTLNFFGGKNRIYLIK